MLSKKNKLRADKFLILYLVYSILRQTYSYVEATGFLDQSYWMIYGKSQFLLHAPVFFFYIHALTQQKPLKLKMYLLVLVPFIAYSLTFLYYYFLIFDTSRLGFENGLMFINGELSLPWAIFVVLFLLIEPFFIGWVYLLLRGYKKRITESLSFADTINLGWLSIIFNIWLVSAVLLLPLSVLSVAGVIDLPIKLLQILIEVASLSFFFILGYYGFKQTAVFSSLDLKKQETPRPAVSSYERSGLTEIQAQDYHRHLLEVMKTKKPYLSGELSLGELAQQLNISVNHLSQVLNTVQKQNFFDFVNSYRVNEVIEKMKDPGNRHLTLLAIGLDSGFNSKTSFNTVFKKFTGETPSRYFQSLGQPKA